MNRVKDIAVKCFRDEAQAILDLIPQLDEHFDAAVDLMLRCTGKVIITGVGKSGHIGAKMAATLSSTGTPAFFINPFGCLPWRFGVMTPDDVVIAISNSGQTDELLRFIPYLLEHHIPLIGISGNPDSLLVQVFHVSFGGQGQPRGLSFEFGTDVFHYGYFGHGRCFGLCAHRDASFSG